MSNPQTLVAKWKPGADPAVEVPVEIRWSDGTLATIEDYIAHLDDTCEILQDEAGALVRIAYLGVVAEVRFDPAIDRWVCVEPDGSQVLDDLGKDASDEEIMVALYELPMVYRATIHRETIG